MITRRPRSWSATGPAVGLLGLVAVLGSLTGCGLVADGAAAGSQVYVTGIEPVTLSFTAPTYQAVLPGERLLVRNGTDRQVLDVGQAAGWLPDGRALSNLSKRGLRLQIVEPARGPVGSIIIDQQPPSRGATALNVVETLGPDAFRLDRYDLDLTLHEEISLPPTDNPDATLDNELERNYFGAVPTIDGSTFVRWHDGSEFYEGGDYGAVLVRDGQLSNVLVNANVVGLYLSADGTGLIGLRQVSGEPCGGCDVDQEIIEIDPVTGDIVAEYGMPPAYDENWNVSAVDKVGDRVAVRFWESVEVDAGTGRTEEVQRGTWVYDGAWSLIEGSEQELTWWQGEERVVARVGASERGPRDGWDLLWLHDGQETPLRGELNMSPRAEPLLGSVAGQLLPPV